MVGRSLGKILVLVILILAVGAMSGCGGRIHDTGEFEKYFVSFQEEAARRGVALPLKSIQIEFGPLDSREYGRCTQDPSFAYIRIDQKRWARMSETSREALLYHELGHCFLGRQHVDEWVQQENRPKSVMHTILLDGQVYAAHKTDLIDELFEPDQSPIR